jgi:hypothetical protein
MTPMTLRRLIFRRNAAVPALLLGYGYRITASVAEVDPGLRARLYQNIMAWEQFCLLEDNPSDLLGNPPTRVADFCFPLGQLSSQS